MEKAPIRLGGNRSTCENPDPCEGLPHYDRSPRDSAERVVEASMI
jgi:hypothetical protein